MKTRKIIHIDMDAFYAAVEIRENPALRGLPIIVGGTPEERGVVSTCSYEARKFGVHSGMASSMALRLCPDAVLIHPHFQLYTEVSRQINEIFHEYTGLVEPLSLDEAYLDVTENKPGIESAIEIAKQIKLKIRAKTHLTASAGVSFNKFLAKVASGYKKPDGLTIVTPSQADSFIANLPIGSFYGVGKVTEKRMLELGIKTGADLREKSIEELTAYFGKSGGWFYNLARGIDESPVSPYRERLSFGREITLRRDILDIVQIKKILQYLAAEVEKMLASEGKKGRTITLKIKYYDFKLNTRSVSIPEPVGNRAEILSYAEELLQKTLAGRKKIRLLGISVSNFEPPRPGKPDKPEQLELPFPG